MAAFYLDENVSERLVVALQDLGHDTISANRLQRKGLSDALQLLFAATASRTFVTYNVDDFILLHKAWQAWPRAWKTPTMPLHAGILLIYPGRGVGITDIASAIHRLVRSAPSLENRLFAWNVADDWHEIR